MSGDGLVERERLEVVERPALERVGVHPVDARLGAPFRRADVAAARVLRRDVGRHRLDGVRETRQLPEQRRQLPVDLLRDERRARQQLVRRLRVELRIGAQEVEERRHVALEAGLLHHLVHLGGDAFDFLEADLVDLLRRQVGRRVLADVVLVVRAPVGKVVRAEGRARVREVLVVEEGEEIAVAGDGPLHDRLASFFAQPLALIGRDGWRELLERRPEDALRDVVDDVRRHRLVVAGERRARHREPALDPHPHQLDLFVDEPPPLPQPADVVLVVLDGSERHVLRQA